MIRTAILSLGLLISLPAWAVDISICYNYSCATQARVDFNSQQIARIRQLFKDASTPAAERRAIANSIGLFEKFAGEQTPTWRDKGGNINDDGVDGRMDCIDHSTNTTTYLTLLERLGLLRFHTVLERVERAPWIVNVHWAAHIQDITTRQEYAVDSWFYDNGHPAVIYPLQDWLKGASPNA